MIFDTMKPEFIRQLAVFGPLCIIFLLACVRAGVQSSGQLASKLKAAAYLSLAVVFAVAFVKTTAPSQRYEAFLRALLWSAAGLSAGSCTVAAAVYLRTTKAFFEPVIRYKDFMDDIDDEIFIFDAAGEPVLHNNPNNRETRLSEIAASLAKAAVSGKDGNFAGMQEHETILDEHHYKVSSSVIRDKKERKAGIALIFHDITTEQLLIDELKAKNELLARTNAELVQAVAVNEALAEQEERERLAAAIRLELEEKMSETLHYIDTLQSAANKNRAKKEQDLRSLAERLRSVLADIRRIVYKTKEN